MRSLANIFVPLGLLAISNCSLERYGLSPGANWNVEPAFFCPGDPVRVSWDFENLPRSRDNCRPEQGGYAGRLPGRCESGSMCPAAPAGICLDNGCCTTDLHATSPARCPTGEGCLPAFSLTVHAAPPLATEPVIDREHDHGHGDRTVTPAATTTFTLDADITSPFTRIREMKTATMIQISPETAPTLPFPFVCAGGTMPGFAPADLTRNPIASEHAIITSVRNTSGHVIQLSGGDPTRGPIQLMRGSSTDVFNGAVRGTWTVVLDPTDPAFLSTPRCTPTSITNRWPDLQVQLVLACSATLP